MSDEPPAETGTAPYPWPKAGRGKRYSAAARALQNEEIERRLLRGESHRMIYEALHLSRTVVKTRVDFVTKAWEEAALETREKKLARMAKRLEFVWTEAVLAWERSKAARESRTASRTSGAGNGEAAAADVSKTSLTTTNQHGDPQYLRTALEAEEKLAKLFGLNAPELVGISWAETARVALSEALRDVEERRAEAANGSGPPN